MLNPATAWVTIPDHAPLPALMCKQVHKDFANAFPTERLIGVFTRDFRKDVHTARVLITVPSCMEILMLTPTHRPWVRRPMAWL
jgi:hypothetical protein